MTTGGIVVVGMGASSASLSTCCSGVSITTVILGWVTVGIRSGVLSPPPPKMITRLKYEPKVRDRNLNGFMVSPAGDSSQKVYRTERGMSSIQLGEEFQRLTDSSRRLIAADELEMPLLCLRAVGHLPIPAELLRVASEEPL